MLLLAATPAQELTAALTNAEKLLGEAKAAKRAAALQLVTQALDELDRATDADGHADAAYWRWMLAMEASRREGWKLAERAWRKAETYYARFPGDKDTYLLAARSGLAEALGRQQDRSKRQEALALQRQVLAAHIAHGGEHTAGALGARHDVAATLCNLESWSEALPEWLALARVYEQSGAEKDLHDVLINLCNVYAGLEDLEALRRTAASMAASARAHFPPGSVERHQRLLAVIATLSGHRLWSDSRLILDEVLGAMRDPEHHLAVEPRLLAGALQQSAQLSAAEGDHTRALAAADECFEIVFREGLLTSGRTSFLVAAEIATSIRLTLGDYQGALELGRRVLGDQPPDTLLFDRLFRVRINTSNAAFFVGDLELQRQLLEANVELLRARFPESDAHVTRPFFPLNCHNLGAAHLSAGNLEQARRYFEMVLASTRSLGEDLRASARLELAWISHRAQPSTATLQDLLTAYEAAERLEDFRPWRRFQRQQMLFALDSTTHAAQVESLLFEGLRDAATQLDEALFLADRERVEVLGHVRPDLDWALSFDTVDQALRQRLAFEVIESRRAAAMAMSGLFLQRRDAALDGKMREYAAVREQLGETVPLDAADRPPVTGDRLQQLSLQRDRLQREIRAQLTQLGTGSVKVVAGELAARLRGGEAAIGFYRYARWRRSPYQPDRPTSEDRFVAHVVQPGKDAVMRVELGRADAIEAAVVAWRDAIGAPVDRGREPAANGSEAAARGRALGKLVFEPLRPALGTAKTVYVCLDDVLHLVPLDALPLDGDRVLGDTLSIRVLPSLQTIVRPLPKLAAAPANLLAVGGIDFAAAAQPVAGAGRQRGDGPFDFERLPFTEDEVVKIGAEFAAVFRKAPQVLRGADAQKATIVAKARQARFLHLATHGWYAPADLRSLADPVGTQVLAASHGHSPLALCGLALAGANQGRDAEGRLPGILTAEHLAGLDLRGCELAVLSACRTNVGLRRGGQSIQSLQTALHAAGARHAVTSLWRVPDALTEQLMVRFYRNLWQQPKPMPAEQALWEAKTWLRKQKGAGVQHWAAWVLTSQ